MKSLTATSLTISILLILSQSVSACPWCRAQVRNDVYHRDFSINLLVLILPVIVLTALGIGLYFMDEITEKLKERRKKWQTKPETITDAAR